jgi:hypothetical protein
MAGSIISMLVNAEGARLVAATPAYELVPRPLRAAVNDIFFEMLDPNEWKRFGGTLQ